MKNGWCPENRKPLAKRMKTEDSNEPGIHPRERERRDDGEDEDDATEMAEYHIKPFEKRRKSKVQSCS